MRISIPRNHTKLQKILIFCPVCQDLEGCLFKGDHPDPPRLVQCSKCRTTWPLQLEILDHSQKVDKALKEGGIIIVPAQHEN